VHSRVLGHARLLGTAEGDRQGDRPGPLDKLAHYQIPRYVLVVEEFPMTVTGKIRKVEMRERSVQLLGLAEVAATKYA
jgi:fatty-acyl-CoA synthase